ncbi:MAG TPA: adenylate/guanylate cyclase domain-containing protein [Reyranella sp.]|nr:adenylate/guanylate cyclase domain-containing protein [Reyranella sp.]
MNEQRRSVPFSVTLLTLMALIVFPLATALLWLGWRAVDHLETRSVGQRMASLETAVEGFLASGLRVVAAVGTTLAEAPGFAPGAGPGADEERLRQFVALLGRYPAMAAVFVGYEDGHFLYAGRPETFSVDQRLEFDAPDGPSIILRMVSGEGASRRETWWFEMPDGSKSPPRSRPLGYDPRTRPWYIDALRTQAPVLTEPYPFAQANVIGVSAGVPLRQGGVIGFDFTLSTLSSLIGDYRITPNSIIMLASDTGTVFMESEACKLERSQCLPGEDAVRAAMRRAVAEFGKSGQRIERDLELGGRDYRLLVHNMAPNLGRRYQIAAAVPLAELSADSRTLLERAALAAAVAVGLAATGALLAALLLSRSLARIAGKTERIRNLDFSDRVPVRSRITEIARLSASIERMREGLEVFGRYVSKNLVHQIMRSPETAGVGGTRREITVMFTDIEGFSLLSETMEPELLTSRLSRYFDVLGSAISANHGMIDKYIGDSIMAFWNAPELDPDHIANACRAALQAAAAGKQLSEKWRDRGRPGFRTRFGLHTGPAVVGNVGARERINYTLVGAVANQASRLEGLNKAYGTEILASGEVAGATADRFVWRPIDRIVAAGTTERHEIHEPLGEIDAAPQHTELLAQWEAGRAAYGEGRFEAALACFRATLSLRPGDGPSRVFIERCTAFLRDGPPKDWDGIWHFDRK